MKKGILKKKSMLISIFGVFFILCNLNVLKTKAETDTAGKDTVIIQASEHDEACVGGVLERYENFQGKMGTSVLFDEDTPINFQFRISNSGLYTIKFDYYAGNFTTNAVVRDILIDGELPFAESAEISLPQLWMDEFSEKRYDKNNNEIRSKQIQVPQWTSEFARDSSGLKTGVLHYFLSEGDHTITLVPKSETLLLYQITIAGGAEVLPYEEILKAYRENGYENAAPEASFWVEAESSDALKSSQMLTPLNDRTTPSVSPYDVNLVRYNSIGAGQWQVANQWIEWKIDVPESGLYQLGTHFKQSFKTNDVSIRELTIDGTVPFAEASSLYFAYGTSWQSNAFGDGAGKPYLFYLEKGIHTIRLRVTLGDAAPLLSLADSLLDELNGIYRKIVVITGAKPDAYANYQLDAAIPDTIEKMRNIALQLENLADEIEAFNGQGGASTAAVKRLIRQLELMTDDTDKIALQLKSFKDNISAFSTWINDSRNQPLQLDKIYIYSPDSELPAGEVGVVARLKHYIVQFFWSFFTDYEAIGVTEEETDAELTVWIATGRDQAQILRQLINDDFTPNHNVSVNLQLITPTALLPSIVAGNNPDVYIGAPQADPLNLSLRNAVLDLKQFSDYEEVVAERFVPETLVPFTYEDHVYALPDAMDYPMLFVRTDIMEELNITREDLKDWDTIFYDVLPKLQTKSLSMGVPVSIQNYLTFLYQRGGSMYTPDGKSSALASSKAIAAMEIYTELYTQYGLSLSYDFANRFRSGEMPLAIANFTSYNQLSVFATDINGLWEMLPVPGTVMEDGMLNTTCTSTVTGSFVLANTGQKDAAWEFLKWWTSEKIQTEYGQGMESISGSAARYNTANVRALENAAWNRSMKSSLLEQLEHIKAFVEVPGGYLTQRYYDFAFRNIVYDGDNVRETMIEKTESINTEIAHKRQEYSLD